MGESFQLVVLRASIDGIVAATFGDLEGAVGEPAELVTPICVLRTRIAPGSHTLALELTYRGHGYGVFSCLSEYRFHATGTLPLEFPRSRCSSG